MRSSTLYLNTGQLAQWATWAAQPKDQVAAELHIAGVVVVAAAAAAAARQSTAVFLLALIKNR